MAIHIQIAQILLKMKNHKILKLNVEHRWFELMVTGQKDREFRKPSDWIKSRLWKKVKTIAGSVPVYEPREYDFIEIRSGYGKHRPYFIAEFQGFAENLEFFF